MRTAFIITFSLLQVSLLAQHRLMVKTNPIYLLDDQRYTLPVGLEYRVGNFSIQAEQMIMVTKYNNYSLRENLNYSKTNLQLRYYIDGVFSGGSLGFFGLHGTVRNYDYLEYSGAFISGEGRNLYFDNSTIETQNYAAFVISGVQVPIARERMVFETVVGFGFRELSVRHNPEEVRAAEHLDPFLFESFEEQWREGTRTLPGVLFQIRVGYVLFQRGGED